MVAVRRWRAASLVVVAALFAGATGEWPLACAAAVVIVAALAVGARADLGAVASRVAAAVAGGAGAAIAWILPSGSLRAPWPSFALAGILAGAALLCRREPGRGSAVSLLPGLAALTACGEAPLGRVYLVVVVAHLSFALLALRAGAVDGSHAKSRRRSVRRLGIVAAIGALLALGFALALPPLAAFMEGRIVGALGVTSEVGFSDRMVLGSIHGLLQSDEVVMRVEGPRVDYLRGAVFDLYENGRWARHRRPTLTRFVPRPPEGREARTRVIVVGGARDRLFVPLGAHAIDPDPPAFVDEFGVLRLSAAARTVSFSVGSAGGDPDALPAAPTREDLAIPPSLRPELERIARAWTEGVPKTPEAQVTALAARLRRDFVYSLEFEHQRRQDPLLDFLLDDHKGHCEYFASALTLLARAVGVPARVAIGYRVAEQSALAETWVVRERNAHAWSEIDLPGRGFVTFDATPEGAVPANEPHRGSLAAAVWDVLQRGAARAIGEITLPRGAVALALGVAALGWLRLRRRARSPLDASCRLDLEPPPPSLTRLLVACASRGVARPSWEPLERFADRLAETSGGVPEQLAAASLVRRWAAYRYGGVGSENALLTEMDACARRLRASG